MANWSQFFQEGENIDYTPTTAVTAGSIIQVGELSAFCSHGIAAGAQPEGPSGALQPILDLVGGTREEGLAYGLLQALPISRVDQVQIII